MPTIHKGGLEAFLRNHDTLHLAPNVASGANSVLIAGISGAMLYIAYLLIQADVAHQVTLEDTAGNDWAVFNLGVNVPFVIAPGVLPMEMGTSGQGLRVTQSSGGAVNYKVTMQYFHTSLS